MRMRENERGDVEKGGECWWGELHRASHRGKVYTSSFQVQHGTYYFIWNDFTHIESSTCSRVIKPFLLLRCFCHKLPCSFKAVCASVEACFKGSDVIGFSVNILQIVISLVIVTLMIIIDIIFIIIVTYYYYCHY